MLLLLRQLTLLVRSKHFVSSGASSSFEMSTIATLLSEHTY